VGGVIVFSPAEEIVSGPEIREGAAIQNGRFLLSRRVGLIPGKYRVAVYAAPPKHAPSKADGHPAKDEAVAADLIPARYNSESKLEVEITATAIKEMRIALRSD
jgi:hypothetical protein